MKFGKGLNIVAHIINITIFIYFVIALFKLGALDILGLLISGFGILIALIANIVEAIEEDL